MHVSMYLTIIRYSPISAILHMMYVFNENKGKNFGRKLSWTYSRYYSSIWPRQISIRMAGSSNWTRILLITRRAFDVLVHLVTLACEKWLFVLILQPFYLTTSDSSINVSVNIRTFRNNNFKNREALRYEVLYGSTSKSSAQQK